MIFQHTWEKVLSGEKTQTRRLVLPNEGYDIDCKLVYRLRDNQEFNRYVVGKTYAVQPGRGKPAIARIRITGIRRENVRDISYEDAYAEGFSGKISFLETWVTMHDGSRSFYADELSGCYRQYRGRKDGWQTIDAPSLLDYLSTRPAARYDSWALTFEVVK